MVNKIKKFADDNRLINSGERILVALSGGADSVCLLYVLLALRSEYALEVDAVHINHMLRGEEAERDACFCRVLCDKLGVRLHMCTEDVRAYAQETRQSIEAAAREVRYNAFYRLKQTYGYDKIAVAHHAQDNVETMLMHLLRGSGLTGLRGILPKRDAIIRPLLEINREEILTYLSENEIAYVIDSTNAETQYARNSIRHDLLAHIQDKYNPNIMQTLSETAQLLRADSACLDALALDAFEKTILIQDESVLVDVEQYRKLQDALAFRVMKMAIARCVGKTEDIPFDTVMRAHSLCCQHLCGKRLDLPDGAFAIMEHAGLYMTKHAKKQEYAYPINSGEKVYLPEAGMSVSVSVVDRIGKEKENVVYFDYDKIMLPIYVRNRRNGDKILMSGMVGSKKLKDFFIDEKIPKHERDVWPLICAGEEILWICGKRRSALCTIDENTKKVLMITCEGKNDEI